MAAEKPWTVNALMRIKTVADPQISPDSGRIAYVVRSVNFDRNAYDPQIWITPADGGRPKLIARPYNSDKHPRWSRRATPIRTAWVLWAGAMADFSASGS
jgi:dipeptidyl aminopeptidase/acylaminoacyl peptidase